MPASATHGQEQQVHEYYRQKLSFLHEMKTLLIEERTAIKALDFERLDQATSKLEQLRRAIDRLDGESAHGGTTQALSKRERATMHALIEELAALERENLGRLIERRDAAHVELEALRTSKSALKAYGSGPASGGAFSEQR